MIVEKTSARVNITAGDDTIVSKGNDVHVNLTGGNTYLFALDGKMTLDGYDLSTGTGFGTNYENIASAVKDGSIDSENGKLSIGDAIVDFETQNQLVNIFDRIGGRQIVGFADKNSALDASNQTKSLLLVGNTNSTVTGGKNNDEILGSAGSDTLDGGEGRDKVYGGNGSDGIFGGKGRDKLFGENGDDLLVGGAGNDTLWGGAGNDTLDGGKGNDTLYGDAGSDKFIYSKGEGKDVIYGFENKDMLEIIGNFKASYDSAANEVIFKVGAGSVTLKEFTATTFNVNGDKYQISGSSLVKK